MIVHAFGESAPFSIGIEEELFVLDAELLEPADIPADVLDGTRIKAELFASLVELATGVCSSASEAQAELRALRAEIGRRLAPHGLVVAASSTWPLGDPVNQAITDDDGFRAFVEYAGSTARRQYCCGLHVHIGVESPADCHEALERVLPWLPLLLAISANSPYLNGVETGLASTRAELLTLLPRSAAPPAFASYEEWERFAERIVALGLADSYTRIWWDIRPHPRFGTLEIRMPDQPTDLDATAGLGALVQALVASPDIAGNADRGIYAQNRWTALRFGRAGKLIHPITLELVSTSDLFEELLELVEPAAYSLGCMSFVERLREHDGARSQLSIGRTEGVLPLAERLVSLTGAAPTTIGDDGSQQ